MLLCYAECHWPDCHGTSETGLALMQTLSLELFVEFEMNAAVHQKLQIIAKLCHRLKRHYHVRFGVCVLRSKRITGNTPKNTKIKLTD